MPFDGNGVFTRLYSWVNDAAAGIKIRADRMDNETNGIAAGLSQCITKDGQTTVTADLPMAGYNHLNVGNADARNQYAAFGQVQDGKANWVAAGGTADVITAAYSPAVPALSDGQLFFVRATGANTTTTPSFNPSGLGAGTIVKNGNQALAVGDIFGAGHELILRRSGTKYELLNPAVAVTLSGNNTFTGTTTFTNAINEARGTAIASATTTNIGAASGNFVHITGTTTITGFGTVQAGTRRNLVFDGILTLTHNATSLILPTGANIITTAGDTATFISEGSGNWRCVSYQRASGDSVNFANGLLAAIGINKNYESAEITYVGGSTSYTATHGLGVIPKMFSIYMRCKIAEGGYSIGDEVQMGNNWDNGVSRQGSSWSNSTNVGFVQLAAMSILNRSTSVAFTPTVANWRIVLRAWG